jgi:hypothetical protein
MTRPPPIKRTVKVTLLIVCEGDAEVAFMRHVKMTYEAGLGRAVTIKNANGKGARHVLEHAIRSMTAIPYDKVVVVVDNDTCWEDHDRRRARDHKILVVESTPCFEATLLKIAGHPCAGSTRDLKKRFYDIIGCEAHEPLYLPERYDRAVLDAARTHVVELGAIMNHMGIAKARR